MQAARNPQRSVTLGGTHMLYAHFKYSDKPLMGSVTAPERTADSVAMVQLVFGEAFVDANACLLSLINVNSPLAFDATMLGALEIYAAANQAVIVSPFLIAGAMAPTTTAGVMVQASAEALVGLVHTQLVRPGAPAIFGTFAASMSMQSGAPTFGTPEPALIMYGMAQIARKLGLPFRPGGHYLGAEHSKANYRDAFYQAELHDAGAFEQWEAEGGSDMAQRAQARVRALLADYQPPALDPGIDEALQDFIARRKGEMPDRAY